MQRKNWWVHFYGYSEIGETNFKLICSTWSIYMEHGAALLKCLSIVHLQIIFFVFTGAIFISYLELLVFRIVNFNNYFNSYYVLQDIFLK